MELNIEDLPVDVLTEILGYSAAGTARVSRKMHDLSTSERTKKLRISRIREDVKKEVEKHRYKDDAKKIYTDALQEIVSAKEYVKALIYVRAISKPDRSSVWQRLVMETCLRKDSEDHYKFITIMLTRKVLKIAEKEFVSITKISELATKSSSKLLETKISVILNIFKRWQLPQRQHLFENVYIALSLIQKQHKSGFLKAIYLKIAFSSIDIEITESQYYLMSKLLSDLHPDNIIDLFDTNDFLVLHERVYGDKITYTNVFGFFYKESLLDFFTKYPDEMQFFEQNISRTTSRLIISSTFDIPVDPEVIKYKKALYPWEIYGWLLNFECSDEDKLAFQMKVIELFSFNGKYLEEMSAGHLYGKIEKPLYTDNKDINSMKLLFLYKIRRDFARMKAEYQEDFEVFRFFVEVSNKILTYRSLNKLKPCYKQFSSYLIRTKRKSLKNNKEKNTKLQTSVYYFDEKALDMRLQLAKKRIEENGGVDSDEDEHSSQ